DSLRRGWSPELIEGRLKAQCAGDPSMRISHECLCHVFRQINLRVVTS
ncbi:hypothetical protein GKC85_10640, partial [Lactobacillus ruminis]|nr:hypothetical protein [Ligilactobacillus ruminis]